MKDIFKVFTQESLESIPGEYLNSEKPMCWYPSSGYDLNHLFFWDHMEKEEQIHFPDVIIHTDYFCLNYNPFVREGVFNYTYDRGIAKKNLIGHPFFTIGSTLKFEAYNGFIRNVCASELKLNEDIFEPNRKILYSPQLKGENTHRIYALEFDLFYNVKDFVPRKFLLLFMAMENSNFFYDILIKNEIKLQYLTHINDGGASMGSSRVKMEFIYLYTDTLGLQHMLLDYSFYERKYFIEKAEWENYFNPKSGLNIRDQRNELDETKWMEREPTFPIKGGNYFYTRI